MIHATCTKCRVRKPGDAFRRNPRRPSGLTTQCAECIRRHDREKHAAAHDLGPRTQDCAHCHETFTYDIQPGKRRIYCSERCKANAAAAARLSREYRSVRRCACGSTDVAVVGKAVCPGCKADSRDRSDYGRRRKLKLYNLTEADVEEMLTLQRGKCAVCASGDPGPRGWFIDHDHACCPGIGSCGNCVRGLLCQECNLLLGHAHDSVDRLESAKKYLLANAQFHLPLKVVR